MPSFDKRRIRELKEYLYYSYLHDTKLNSVRYEQGENSICIKVLNPTSNVEIDLTFYDIKIVLAIGGYALGGHETIIMLTAEEDVSYLQNYTQQNCKCFEDSLYILFQMLSGGELHIVSREVVIEVNK